MLVSRKLYLNRGVRGRVVLRRAPIDMEPDGNIRIYSGYIDYNLAQKIIARHEVVVLARNGEVSEWEKYLSNKKVK